MPVDFRLQSLRVRARGEYGRLTKRIDARDRMAARAQRTEQAYLQRHFLGGRSHGPGCLCRRDFPVEFLVAAHVKRRADCAPKEREDPRNVVPMCRFGCDELYERGFDCVIGGKLTRNDRMMTYATGAVKDYRHRLPMQTCLEWKRARQYFEWHAQGHIEGGRPSR